MRQTRMDKRLSLRELGAATGIKMTRLCDIEQRRAAPTTAEVDALILALGPGIRFEDPETARKNMDAHLAEMEAMTAVMEQIRARGFKKGAGGAGVVTCPKCGADIHFRVWEINGHTWFKCDTEECLGMMQ